MKQKLAFIIIVSFLLKINSVSAQSQEVRFLIDTCITIMKKHALNPRNLNFDDLEKNAMAKANGITSAYELGPVFRYLYESMNDFHGAFYYKDSVFRWTQKKFVPPDSVTAEWKKGTKVKTKILDNNIGYLVVPGIQFSEREEMNKKTQNLNDSLCYLLSKNIKGIIIDARTNGGGAMYPMILGTEALLGDGQVGSFHGTANMKWFVKDNKFFLDTMNLVSLNSPCIINGQNIPVVFLTSSATGSSGEFFIIAFKGRKKTILLGSTTAGYITSVAGFLINDYTNELLSTGYGADRNGKLYKEALQPDIPLEAVDKFNDIENDEKVKAAVEWLKKNF
jgi:carboxyl-terminal processing protease